MIGSGSRRSSRGRRRPPKRRKRRGATLGSPPPDQAAPRARKRRSPKPKQRSREPTGARGKAPKPKRHRVPWVRTPAGLRSRLAVWGGITVLFFATGYLVAAWRVFPASEETAVSLITVENVTGQSTADAAERLGGSGLVALVEEGLHHGRVRAGDVVAQVPMPGLLAAPGDTVRLVPSRGAVTREVPGLEGLPRAQAVQLLRGMGFETGVAPVVERGPPGVIRSEPPTGARVTLPATVEVFVREGETIAPDLVGRPVAAAVALLDSASLAPGAVSYLPGAPELAGIVLDQAPSAGSNLDVGSLVSFVVAGNAPDPAGAEFIEQPPPGDSIPPFGRLPPPPDTGVPPRRVVPPR